ncbi:AAA family ATPase [Actinomadura roseirufa]|uniref:AAA family ATPase n=1 Tax=Actinomadura roseirufa TaxID=2094049 RepID=UPI00104107BA|nr:AAA family ATPase [Actinomadura roseirufa]
MTDDIGHPVESPSPNPFPAGAVAMLGDPSVDAITIPTASITLARDTVEDYLARDHRPPAVPAGPPGPAGPPAATGGGSGEVVMVSGEPGTGKTHLLNEIVHRARHPAGPARPATTCVSIGAHGPGFYQTYREAFIRKFDFEDVAKLVTDVYAHVVADHLGGSGRAADLVARLRAGTADPRTVVQRLGQQNLFLSRLRERLPGIAGDQELGRVLPLLVHPRLDMDAWEWLQGLAPTPSLREHGVTGPLTEPGAMRAMGVFATLHGWLGRRFVLAVDDLEKLLDGGAAAPPEPVRAIRTLVDAYIAGGGLLVLSALPEFFEVLPKDVPPRVRTQIVPEPLTAHDTREYIDLRRRRYDGPTLDFDADAVEEIVRLTGGAPRPVLRLCYRSYQVAEARRHRLVGVPAVHQAARRRFGEVREPVAEVGDHLERVLTAKGWTFAARHRLPVARGETERVHFWVPIPAGQENSGCAILVAGAVLQDADAAPLRAACARLRAAWPDRRVLVVAAEFLAQDLRPGLAEAGGAEPVGYQPSDFPDVLNGRLEGLFARVGPARRRAAPAAPAADPGLAVFRDQMDRVGRQVSHTQDHMSELAVRLEEFRQESERQWRELRESVRPDPPAGDGGAPGGPALSPELAALFNRALGSLGAVDTVTDLLDGSFAAGAARSGPAGPMLVHRLRRANAFEAIGVALTLRKLLVAFRRSVADWLEQTRDRPPDDADRARLGALCDTYEAIYQTVPLSPLDRLGDFAVHAGDRDLPSREDRRARHLAILRNLDGLGGLVRATALAAAEQP